jgi:hypothetical protein
MIPHTFHITWTAIWLPAFLTIMAMSVLTVAAFV